MPLKETALNIMSFHAPTINMRRNIMCLEKYII